jgi:hypothetical protein
MSIPKDIKIPKSSGQFAKLQEGANKYRILSDIIYGWEGWKDNKPFRHEGEVCKIKPEQVDLSKSGKPNINYFWAMVAWSYGEKRIQILQLTQKTIMQPLYDFEQNEDWGDLKGYDITISKTKNGDKTNYTVAPSPHKDLLPEIKQAYEETDVKLEKIFEGEYPIEEEDESIEGDNSPF